MEIIRNSSGKEVISYSLRFSFTADRFTSGFAFTCNADGKVDLRKLKPAARRSYAACRAGVVDGRPIYLMGRLAIRGWKHTPAIGKCDCGRQITLSGFTNSCECGADFNSAGQRLSPRSWWGEETGEHPADIARL